MQVPFIQEHDSGRCESSDDFTAAPMVIKIKTQAFLQSHLRQKALVVTTLSSHMTTQTQALEMVNHPSLKPPNTSSKTVFSEQHCKPECKINTVKRNMHVKWTNVC